MKTDLPVISMFVAFVLIVSAFFYGQKVGADGQVAEQAVIDKAIADTRQAALEGAADAIAKIKVRNTTIQGRVDTIIKENPVYGDCKHTPESLRLLNEALTGRPGPTGSSGMPGINTVN